jgi:hypothetical protein
MSWDDFEGIALVLACNVAVVGFIWVCLRLGL